MKKVFMKRFKIAVILSLAKNKFKSHEIFRVALH